MFNTSGLAAQSEQEIVESFQEVAKKHIESYNDDPRILVYHIDAILPPYGSSPPAWIKSKNIIIDNYSIDVEKTNSLVTPYTGILFYKMQILIVKEKTKTEAENSTKFNVNSKPKNYKILFSYQNGKWIAKEYLYQFEGNWYDAEKEESTLNRMKVKE